MTCGGAAVVVSQNPGEQTEVPIPDGLNYGKGGPE